MKRLTVAAMIAFCLLGESLQATTRYVWTNSPSPSAPYTSWNKAAREIQTAVDAAVSNDLILVTNGTYETGGIAVYSNMTNRVAINKPIMVQSVNGPSVTIIKGVSDAATAIRCAYVTNGASLVGFTLTNGGTLASGDYSMEQSGGGVWCEDGGIVSNCTLTGNRASIKGGGAYYGTLNNCTLTGNTANSSGGGAAYCTLNNCTLTGNRASIEGGGVNYGTLNNCTLMGNIAEYGGGAGGFGTLNNCTLTGNTANHYGGGAYYCTLNNCTLTGNTANIFGGGAYYCTLNNCMLTGNTADYGGGALFGILNNCTLTGNIANHGGGAVDGTLNNCTLTGNTANNNGGGALFANLNNCIVYFNTASSGPNYTNSNLSNTINYSCTTPMPQGVGNITNDPLFISTNDFRLTNNSPCVNTGTNELWMTGTNDLDGNPRIIGPSVDMGAYEYALTPSGVNGAWLVTNGFPADGSADGVDTDGDLMNTAQEYMAGTDPNSGTSRLTFESMQTPSGSIPGVVLRWQSVSGKHYSLFRGTNLTDSPICGVPVSTNIIGQAPMNTITDSTAIGTGPWFYRVKLE